MAVIGIGFDDFKKIVRDRRIYYFEGENFLDLHFLFEGFIVKSTISKEIIGNPKQFFSDKMFFGAMKLNFNIPIEKENPITNVLELKLPMPMEDIEDIQDEEVKETDIQREGVGLEDGNNSG